MRNKLLSMGTQWLALLDTGSQITHISEAFCQAKGIQIDPLNHLVEIEGTGGTV